jgi:hypothetical protein
MTKAYVPFSFSLSKDAADYKLLVIQQLKVRGNGRPPEPPRDVQAQPGSRGALLTWKLPVSGADWIRGWKVYKDTESQLVQEIHDPGQRQLYVALTSGATPPITNLFVSSITAAGAESVKVVVKASAIAEVGAPAVPSPPPGYADEKYGGGCVLEGTSIVALGNQKFTVEKLPESHWVRIVLVDKRELTCTLNHPLFDAVTGKVEAWRVRVGRWLITDTGEAKVAQVKKVTADGVKLKVSMDSGHLFFANGFLSHNLKKFGG